MFESFTAGALRAIRRAEARARERSGVSVEPIDIMAGLADEAESRAAVLLIEFGLDPRRLLEALGLEVEAPPDDPDGPGPMPLSPEARASLVDASSRARSLDRGQSVGTEHLLAGIIAEDGPIVDRLFGSGLEVAELREELARAEAAEGEPLPMADDIEPLELVEPGQAIDLGRILDASANRAREGLRVVEDYARFALGDPMLTRRIKDVRHRLGEAIRGPRPRPDAGRARHPRRRRHPHHDRLGAVEGGPPRRPDRQLQAGRRGAPVAGGIQQAPDRRLALGAVRGPPLRPLHPGEADADGDLGRAGRDSARSTADGPRRRPADARRPDLGRRRGPRRRRRGDPAPREGPGRPRVAGQGPRGPHPHGQGEAPGSS